ncbi:flagellin [Nocardioides mangrovicus]|uniref:Flagellin n=1 Tax=Nocardioides mangrovicus TaxID=2478913 RepID=A0A3L8P193_9ACTN|nr:flagellin [Nocardioides mangrovicus]RLV48791.1 flagellin [Nocardioides mangrovicus]
MSLRINTNTDSLNAYRNLSVTQSQMSKSLEKLSSGSRINRAADDAAGLAISEGLKSQIGSLNVAVRNAQDGVSVAQTAEGALTEVHSMLQRMNDLATQYANATNNSESQTALSTEFSQLATEIGKVQDNANFNGVNLFAAATGSTLSFQVGSSSTDTIDIDTPVKFDASTLSITTQSGITDAINTVSATRADLGAVQNRFEHRINSTNVAIENLTASESRIADTDMASEMASFTRSQILSQAGTAMLAQANQAPQSVLKLLQ